MHGYAEFYWLAHHWHWYLHGFHWLWITPLFLGLLIGQAILKDRRSELAKHRAAMFPGGCVQRDYCQRRDRHTHLDSEDRRRLAAVQKRAGERYGR